MSLPKLMVAPNGARLRKADHPAVPLTHDEIVACAVACYEAGADGIHAHIRDENGNHLLDAKRYAELISTLRNTLPEMAVQITTEAVGVYEPDTQMHVALESGANMVSASIREIRRTGRQTAADFYAECEHKNIAVQHILYDASDCLLLEETLDPAALTNPHLQLLYVLGRHSANSTADPAELTPFLDWQQKRQLAPDWAVCAFGTTEMTCLQNAVKLGGKCRIGFENSLSLSDGTIAADNAEKVVDFVTKLSLLRAENGA